MITDLLFLAVAFALLLAMLATGDIKFDTPAGLFRAIVCATVLFAIYIGVR
jgi:ABC-type polysaccharide transport system permease subunit